MDMIRYEKIELIRWMFHYMATLDYTHDEIGEALDAHDREKAMFPKLVITSTPRSERRGKYGPKEY